MLAAAALLAGCGGSDEEAGERTAAPSGRLIQLAGLGPFSQQFAADRGKPRFIFILSPT